MTKDLGTYFLKIEFMNGKGWIQEFSTGRRFVGGGTRELSILDATPMPPTWENEDDLISTILYLYEEGNYSCNCNKELFWSNVNQGEDPESLCGNSPEWEIKNMEVVSPDNRYHILYRDGERVDCIEKH